MSSRFSALSPYWIWALFSIPAALMLSEALTSDNSRVFHMLVHPSGEFSARFMIIAMMATPLCLLLKGWRGPLWLKKNRRYLGVAAFGYALLHTVFYVLDTAPVYLDGLGGFCDFHPTCGDVDGLLCAHHGATLEELATLDIPCRRSDVDPLGRFA